MIWNMKKRKIVLYNEFLSFFIIYDMMNTDEGNFIQYKRNIQFWITECLPIFGETFNS